MIFSGRGGRARLRGASPGQPRGSRARGRGVGVGVSAGRLRRLLRRPQGRIPSLNQVIQRILSKLKEIQRIMSELNVK